MPVALFLARKLNLTMAWSFFCLFSVSVFCLIFSSQENVVLVFVVVVIVSVIAPFVVIRYLSVALNFSSQETKPCHRRARLAWPGQERAHLRRKVKNSRISNEKKHWLLMTLIVLFWNDLKGTQCCFVDFEVQFEPSSRHTYLHGCCLRLSSCKSLRQVSNRIYSHILGMKKERQKTHQMTVKLRFDKPTSHREWVCLYGKKFPTCTGIHASYMNRPQNL